jgi:hypothetical protein
MSRLADGEGGGNESVKTATKNNKNYYNIINLRFQQLLHMYRYHSFQVIIFVTPTTIIMTDGSQFYGLRYRVSDKIWAQCLAQITR